MMLWKDTRRSQTHKHIIHSIVNALILRFAHAFEMKIIFWRFHGNYYEPEIIVFHHVYTVYTFNIYVCKRPCIFTNMNRKEIEKGLFVGGPLMDTWTQITKFCWNAFTDHLNFDLFVLFFHTIHQKGQKWVRDGNTRLIIIILSERERNTKYVWESIYADLHASVSHALHIMIWKIIWNYFIHLFGLAVFAFNHGNYERKYCL